MGYYSDLDILYGSGRRAAPQPVRRAELHITVTSSSCARYTLVEAGAVIWSNRVYDRWEGHEGARARLASWALKHRVTIRARQDAPAVVERQAQLEVAGRMVGEAYRKRPQPAATSDPNWPAPDRSSR